MTVAIPVFNEEAQIAGCLEAVVAQTYQHLLEILVVDGGSSDDTREVACRFAFVRVLDNPRRIRAAGLNLAIAAAKGDLIVRVDARTRIASDYVERCVDVLEATGAAIVGGSMRLTAQSPAERAIRTAMTSRLGAGGAQFRRHQSHARYVDTVYLGAYRVDTVVRLGGYDEWFGGNEDAELAYRARRAGGVFLDPAISSTYAVRTGLGPLCQQYFRYGANRTRTMIKHPRSIALRQLAVPCLLLGLVSPWRRPVAVGYAALVAGRAAVEMTRDPAAAPWLLAVVPMMHGAWGAGFLRALAGARSRPSTPSPG